MAQRKKGVQLPEGEVYQVDCKGVRGGVAAAALRDYKEKTLRNAGNVNIRFSEHDQCFVVSGIGRWAHPDMEKEATKLAKTVGFFLEELNRLLSWVLLKRLHHGEHIPAIYADQTFIQAGIGVILQGGQPTINQGPTEDEYRYFLNDVRGGITHFDKRVLTQRGMATYIKQNTPASMLADARRAVSERMVPKMKAFVLSILRQEKNCHRLAKVDAEALLEEQREIVDALAWGKEHASIQQRSALRELKKNLTGLIAAGVQLRTKGEKKSHLARALESDKHFWLCALPDTAFISTQNLFSPTRRYRARWLEKLMRITAFKQVLLAMMPLPCHAFLSLLSVNPSGIRCTGQTFGLHLYERLSAARVAGPASSSPKRTLARTFPRSSSRQLRRSTQGL
jgi:hypothetical protein